MDITLFTEPSLYPWFQLYKFSKNIVKKIIGRPILPYSGHFAVMRSIITGLTEAGVSFEYNPGIPKFSYKHVHVFGNVSALKMAIFLKKLGIIKYLTAGPNIVISSADENGILASKHIDKVIVPSDWVRKAYLIDNDKLLPEKMVVWPAGVDVNYWNIDKQKHSDRVNFMFYIKRPEKEILEACETIVKNNNIGINKIYHGKYELAEFKKQLAMTDCVVYFVEQESQGIALSEIWATDTPVLVWNPGIWHYTMKNYSCSSAPYLTTETGRFFRDEAGFELIVSDFLTKKVIFTAREYTLKHFSDTVSTSDFLSKINFND